MNILVVDDNASVRSELRTAFEQSGHAVLTASSGMSAITAAEKQSIDLMVSDVLMPKIDGFTLCYTLRKNQVQHNLYVLLYSQTFLGQDALKVAASAGADHYLEKASPRGIFEFVNKLVIPEERPVKVMPDEMAFLLQRNKLLLSRLQDAHGQFAEIEETIRGLQLVDPASSRAESVTGFVHRFSHDLNNLLSIVMSYALFIRKNAQASDQIRQDATEIENAGRQSTELAKRLMDFVDKEKRDEKAATSMVQQRTDVSGSPVTIMLVEDEMAVRQVLVRILEKSGYQVISAEDPLDALANAERNSSNIQVLLTDFFMPNMNGVEFARRFSQMHPESQIIFMSGNSGLEIVEQDSWAKKSIFLTKPIMPDVLCRHIEEVVG